jgi:pimeloyl-ACP methyl ester carboxylesterase
MPLAPTDGYDTAYELRGDGPPLLCLSPGGFDARAEHWWTLGRYRQLRLIDHLATRYTCIVFDRRESGHSGGRVQRLGWDAYGAQAVALLDHLGIAEAHLLGGCVGCSVALHLAVRHPERVRSMALFSPAGGARYRLAQLDRLARHHGYVAEHGLGAVVELARSTEASFSTDPRVGPWAPLLRRDAEFARRYATLDVEAYLTALAGTGRQLFDRDTVPGAEPEDLLRCPVPAVVVPGQDRSHATSGARYLEECLADVRYVDVPVAQQSEELVARTLLEFFGDVGTADRLGATGETIP